MARASALVTLFFIQQEYIMSRPPLSERSTHEQVEVIKGLIHEMLHLSPEEETPSLEQYAIILKRWRIVYSTFMLAIEQVYQDIRASKHGRY